MCDVTWRVLAHNKVSTLYAGIEGESPGSG